MPLLPLVAILGVAVLWQVYRRLCFSPLDNLRGPTPKSWMIGNIGQLLGPKCWDFMDELEDYGGVARVQGLGGARMVFVSDLMALQHIYSTEVDKYDVPRWMLEAFRYVFGYSLSASSGDVHRRQRRMLGPIFAPDQLRQLVPASHDVADQVSQIIAQETVHGSRVLDLYELLSRTTLEVMGEAFFGYSFGLFKGADHHPFARDMKAFLIAAQKLSKLGYFSPWFKYLGPPTFRRWLADILPIPGLRSFAALLDDLQQKAEHILAERRKALVLDDVTHGVQGNDLMGILLRANTAAESHLRLPDDQVVSQMSSIIFGGSDSTSATMVQVLELLAKHPSVQTRLRDEVLAAMEDHDLSYDEIHDLPFLDAVYRETLRLYPPASYLFRQALQDTVLPLAEPIRGENGEMLRQLAVPRGTQLIIAIRSVNTNRSTWGEDALEWKPERWLSPLPNKVASGRVPSIYSQIFTFGSGPRACLGFKFAELELKTVISTLVSRFKFSLPDNHDICWSNAGFRYPVQRGSPVVKPTMPLCVEPISA